MAPLSASFEGVRLAYVRHDETSVYKASFDPEWTIFTSPHGGYALGLIVAAADFHQRDVAGNGAPLDATHVTAHYFKPATKGSADVQVKVVKRGKGYWHLSAQLVQNRQVRITAHLIYSTIPEDGASVPSTTPNYSVKCPVSSLPDWRTSVLPPVFNFKRRIDLTIAPDIEHRRRSIVQNREPLDWAGWLRLRDEGETFFNSPAFLAFASDIFYNPAELVEDRPPDRWYPTMVLTLQFFTKIGPSSAARFDPSTVGIFSTGNVVVPPDGRHDVSLQIWTAPRPDDKGDWRSEQKLLCEMNQMALAIKPAGSSSPNAKL